MFPPLLAALAMSKEGEQKTILQVYVSSISAHEFLLGKIAAFMVIALCEWVLCMLTLFTLFGLTLAGDPTPLVVGTVLYAFCVSAYGTLIGAAIPNQAAAIQAVALGGFLLVFLLSGLLFPVENIPAGLRWISNIVWGRYYIQLVRDALLQGGGWPAMWSSVLAIAMHRLRLLCPCLAANATHAGERMKRAGEEGFRQRLGALMRKEFNQIRRDRRLAMSLIVPPTLQLAVRLRSECRRFESEAWHHRRFPIAGKPGIDRLIHGKQELPRRRHVRGFRDLEAAITGAA